MSLDINALLEKLTLEEKVSLLSGGSAWYTQPIERLGIPKILMTDGPIGLRLSRDHEGISEDTLGNLEKSTAYPCSSAIASTFNEKLVESVGREIARQFQEHGVSLLLAPGINGKRTPLCGRNFEYMSEDPYLSGRMAVSYINGVQCLGVGTTLKHYVANDQENKRFTVNAVVEDRALREIYLAPFEMAVKEANPWAVMGSYNRVNGVHCCENRTLLLDVLREEWGFDGLVVSDWTAITDKAASIKNGCDLEMPGPSMRDQEVLDAFNKGDLTITDIDARVRRVLQFVDRAIENKKEVNVDYARAHEFSRKAAEEAIVLLKNEDVILPLQADLKIAVLGEQAADVMQGGGCAKLDPERISTPLDELRKRNPDLVYARGYTGDEVDERLIQEAKLVAAEAHVALVFVGTTSAIESEGFDRTNMRMADSHLALINEVTKVNRNVIVLISSGAAVEVHQFGQDVKAIFQLWYPGQAAGEALVRLIYGEVSPSGKLSETFPVHLENTPTFDNGHVNAEEVTYKEGLQVGYRYYDTKKIPVQYPFGFGLSYTSFEYSNLELSSTGLKNDDLLEVTLDVTNSGGVKGKESVQVYVHDVRSQYPRPVQELKGFAKVELEPGETKRVTVLLNERAFAYFVPHLNDFAVETGEFEIRVGASSRDIRLTESVQFKSEDSVTIPLTDRDSVLDWLSNPESSDRMRTVMNDRFGGPYRTDSSIYCIMSGLTLRKFFDHADMLCQGHSQNIEELEAFLYGEKADISD